MVGNGVETDTVDPRLRGDGKQLTPTSFSAMLLVQF